ncbi:MAG: uracil-DNA glycosylase [Oxalobacteraceae bacterium]|nr:uracil-DNA glycosylase [Oxalobacteraceae bacterium]
MGAIWVRRAAEPVADSGPAVEAASVIDVADLAALASVAARPEPVLPLPVGASAEGAHAAWDEAPLATDPATLPSESEIALMDWPQLQAAVTACRGCDLCRTRNQTVFGSGDRRAKWLFVGEGPGRTEDQQGAPFVGPAGKLLDGMLAAIGLQRDANVYLANVVKCRSADANGADRAPSPQQSALCKHYLERQIALLQPTVIVALGKTAALALLECAPDTSLASLRGQLQYVNQTPTVVTYHPAYLLRNPIAKREAWDDLCMALRTYDQSTDPAAE